MRALIGQRLHGAGRCIRAAVLDGAEQDLMIELGVNIDHVATVRQARRTYEPDPVWAAVEAHLGGADGITVHLREDRRHIQDEDVRRLRELTHIKLNLEMAATDEMVGIACAHQAGDGDAGARGAPRGHHRRRPRRRRQEKQLEERGRSGSPTPASSSRVFIDATCAQVEAAARIGAAVCEIHTGPVRARLPFARAATPRAPPVVAELEKIRKRGRGDPRARHALQRRPRAQLLQRAAGRGAAGRARAAHRPRHRQPRACSSACARRCAR